MIGKQSKCPTCCTMSQDIASRGTVGIRSPSQRACYPTGENRRLPESHSGTMQCEIICGGSSFRYCCNIVCDNFWDFCFMSRRGRRSAACSMPPNAATAGPEVSPCSSSFRNLAASPADRRALPSMPGIVRHMEASLACVAVGVLWSNKIGPQNGAYRQ